LEKKYLTTAEDIDRKASTIALRLEIGNEVGGKKGKGLNESFFERGKKI